MKRKKRKKKRRKKREKEKKKEKKEEDAKKEVEGGRMRHTKFGGLVYVSQGEELRGVEEEQADGLEEGHLQFFFALCVCVCVCVCVCGGGGGVHCID